MLPSDVRTQKITFCFVYSLRYWITEKNTDLFEKPKGRPNITQYSLPKYMVNIHCITYSKEYWNDSYKTLCTPSLHYKTISTPEWAPGCWWRVTWSWSCCWGHRRGPPWPSSDPFGRTPTAAAWKAFIRRKSRKNRSKISCRRPPKNLNS